MPQMRAADDKSMGTASCPEAVPKFNGVRDPRSVFRRRFSLLLNHFSARIIPQIACGHGRFVPVCGHEKKTSLQACLFFMPADRHKSAMAAGDLRYNSSREMVEQERKTAPENRSGITDSVKFGNRFRAGGGSHALIVCCAHLRHLWCLQKPPSCRFRTLHGCLLLRRTAPS